MLCVLSGEPPEQGTSRLNGVSPFQSRLFDRRSGTAGARGVGQPKRTAVPPADSVLRVGLILGMATVAGVPDPFSRGPNAGIETSKRKIEASSRGFEVTTLVFGAAKRRLGGSKGWVGLASQPFGGTSRGIVGSTGVFVESIRWVEGSIAGVGIPNLIFGLAILLIYMIIMNIRCSRLGLSVGGARV